MSTQRGRWKKELVRNGRNILIMEKVVVKTKINVLRVQLRREMEKVSKTKLVRQQTKSKLGNGCFMKNSSF